MDETIGKFTILGKLEQGGMGAVYVGHDPALDRKAAIKVLLDQVDSSGQQRFLLEAKAAASVTHPNICQIYEVGEDAGRSYIAMELLEGETLSARLSRGALPLEEALEITLQLLTGLDEIHRHGYIHRDLKPSNVQLTPHGVKILDFGLVRRIGPDEATAPIHLTQPGVTMGTPQYMAPEQWSSQPVGIGADIFAIGTILYEMISGRQAFKGESVYEVCDAIAHHQPPALSGGAAVVAADRIIQRAMEKRPSDRFPSAAAMADAIRDVMAILDRGESVPIRQTTRLIALPFRILRPDPETDFLAFSLPDAIAGSLSRLDSVVVRSTMALQGRDVHAIDLKALAREVDVDLILSGTLLRAGDRIRVTAQLTEGSSGTIRWTQTAQGTLGDLFALQDSLLNEISDSLALPLAGGERSLLRRETPTTPKAYEIYLRANQLTLSRAYASTLIHVRDLYRKCVEDDPLFAPGWARLGRVYRMIAKYGHDDSDANYELAAQSFSRAMRLDPELSIAHNYYTYLQIEEGRALEAMVRLIERAHKRSADPGLFAGLVPACRFCGLLKASLAADQRARRLDPGIGTSVHYTYWMMGDFESAISADNDEPPLLRAIAPAMLGRLEEATALHLELERRGMEGAIATHSRMVRAAIAGDRASCVSAYGEFRASKFRDPEGIYGIGRNLARVGALEEAIECLTGVVDGGFWCIEAAFADPWLDPIREDARFRTLLLRAEDGRRSALAEYRRAGGDRLLGAAQ